MSRRFLAAVNLCEDRYKGPLDCKITYLGKKKPEQDAWSPSSQQEGKGKQVLQGDKLRAQRKTSETDTIGRAENRDPVGKVSP